MTDQTAGLDESLAAPLPELPIPPNLEPIVLRFDRSMDSSSWVTRASKELIETLRVRLVPSSRPARFVVVAVFPDDAVSGVDARAAKEALRGIVQATTREIAHSGTLINLITVAAGAVARLADTFELLAAPHGGYVAGYTFDLMNEESAR